MDPYKGDDNEKSNRIEMKALTRSVAAPCAVKGSGAPPPPSLQKKSASSPVFSAENLIIETAGSFMTELSHLNEAQCTEVYNRLKNRLPSLIHSYTDLRMVLLHLTTAQCKIVCKMLGSAKGSDLKLSFQELEKVFFFLNTSNSLEQKSKCSAVYYSDLIKPLIEAKTVHPLQAISTTSTADSLTVNVSAASADSDKVKVFGYLMSKDCLEESSLTVKTLRDFTVVLSFLSKKQSFTLYEKIKNTLIESVSTVEDICGLLNCLWSPKQRIDTYNIIKQQGGSVLNKLEMSKDTGKLLAFLSPKECSGIFHEVLERVVKLALTKRAQEELGSNFQQMLSCLKSDQCGKVCELLKEKDLKTLIPSLKVFNQLIYAVGLNSRSKILSCGSIFIALKDYLPTLVQSNKEFLALNKTLDSFLRRKNDFYEAFLSNIDFLKALTTEFMSQVMNNISASPEEGDQLKEILRAVKLAKSKDMIKNKLSEFIDSVKGFQKDQGRFNFRFFFRSQTSSTDNEGSALKLAKILEGEDYFLLREFVRSDNQAEKTVGNRTTATHSSRNKS